MAKPRYNRTVEEYKIPDITLINQDGERVPLVKYLDTEQPVILEFIFATCTTICPILSIGYTNLQDQLGAEAANLRLVSISIDPEYDTPEVMKAYLQRYNAQPGWDFLTGSIGDINVAMRAFDAFVPDKMGHRPLIFLRSPKEKTWVRIDGLMSGKELKNEYLQLKK
ncbi:MAG: SCO family protein [Proteobacteria bacterium]|nr:SCO family protein [Pseudomonadota bacterium]MBU1057475.1 SCO family protein [Pseudomonadota bacterium]